MEVVVTFYEVMKRIWMFMHSGVYLVFLLVLWSQYHSFSNLFLLKLETSWFVAV